MKRLLVILVSVSIVLSLPAHETAESVKHQSTRKSVGLVLSGGGAKGIAHAGVIQAFEENGIPIDYIAGTSMGAIVGGLYASGYTPYEIIDLILSKEFSAWSTGKVDPSLTYYYLKPEQTPAIVRMNIGHGDGGMSTTVLPSSFISPIPMNIGFVEVFAPHTAVCQGDFNKLFVPFRCITSDVYNKKKVVLSSGNLGNAIRMSMTFPVAFKPIEMDSLPMFDGGIYDNFPVDVMKTDFAPDVIIGVDVTTHQKEDLSNLISQLESMIIQQDDYTLSQDDGVKIHIDLHGYNLLDFPKAKEIFDIGYRSAMEMVDSIKRRTGVGVSKYNIDLRRSIYKSKVPDIKFDSLKVVGTSRRAENYIRHIFLKNNTDTIGIEEMKDAYYRTISGGKFRDLVPSPIFRKNSKMFDLCLKATVKDNLGLGVGGYVTSSANSLAYLSASYETIDLNSFSGEVSGWIGQSYYGGFANAKMSFNSSLPTIIRLQGGASRQKFYEDDVLFFEDNIPTFVSKSEFFGNLIIGIGIGRHSKFEVKCGYGFLVDKFYHDKNVDFSTTAQDEADYKLGLVSMKYDYNTLDSDIFPTSGLRLALSANGMMGNHCHYDGKGMLITDYKRIKWAETELDLQKYFNFSNKFKLGTRLNALASTKKLYDSYTASVVQAPAFMPTQNSKGKFNPSFQANSYAAIGLIPIYIILDDLQLRSEFYAFSPMRSMCNDGNDGAYYGDWFRSVNFMGELSMVYNFSFASLSAYCNYVNSPNSKWSCGVSFGFFLTVPKFLR